MIKEIPQYIAGLPLTEIYLHGAIAGKDERIEQLQSELTRLKEEDTILVDKLNEI